MLIGTQIMAQKRNSRWRPPPSWFISRGSFWHTADFPAVDLNHRTKFCANISIESWLTVTFQNSRWRPSAILEWKCCMFIQDHPRSLCCRSHQLVKFYVNPMHSFEDMGFDFLQICLEMPIHRLWSHDRRRDRNATIIIIIIIQARKISVLGVKFLKTYPLGKIDPLGN